MSDHNDAIYEQAWHASPLAILTIEPNGCIGFANPASERLFGCSAEAFVGTELLLRAHRMDRGSLHEMLTMAASGQRPARQEIRFLLPAGGDVVTGFNVSPPPDDSGTLVCVLRDLRHEKTFRPRMLHTERMASMGMVAALVAHELNNALAGALGCLQLLMQELPEENRELVRTASGELQRAGEIVQDLKSYSKAEEGMAEEVDCSELIDRVVKLHKFHGPHLVPVVIDVEARLPSVRGNANQLLQAVLNLVRNAEHACASPEAARPLIRLSVRARADVVVIEVRDHGHGIAPEHRRHLFEPFFTTKQQGEGTGLGLAVVQAVAVGHGGRVEVDETPGGGATFRMVLPSSMTVAEQLPELPEPRRVRPALHGAHILVADDEAVLRLVLRRACERQGAVMTVVMGADEAIEALRHTAFDVVLLDVRMPGGGGARVFAHLRETQPELVPRTIFVSGELSPDMTQIVGAGYAAILPKPFLISQLLDCIEDVLLLRS